MAAGHGTAKTSTLAMLAHVGAQLVQRDGHGQVAEEARQVERPHACTRRGEAGSAVGGWQRGAWLRTGTRRSC